jgi:hypothetical protein
MRQKVALAAVAAAIAGVTIVGFAQGKGKTDPVLMTIASNGQVLHTHSTTAIYWGQEWLDPTVAGDIISGMASFFEGFDGSRLAGVMTEYYDRNGSIASSSTYNGHLINPADPPDGPLSSAVVLAEACRATSNQPDANTVYFVYASKAATLPGTCAIRSWGTCGRRGPSIQAVYVPYMTGTDPGCNGAQNHDDPTVTGHSVALAQYGNVTANQLMNAVTDPYGRGWKDVNGHTISFKCDGIFLPDGEYALFSNGSQWTVRMKWSNEAYKAGSGAANNKGQLGCVY